MALIRCGAGATEKLYSVANITSAAGTSQSTTYTVLEAGTINVFAICAGAWTAEGGTITVDVLVNGTSVLSDLTQMNNTSQFVNDRVTSYEGKLTVAANDVITVNGTISGATPAFAYAEILIA